MTALLELRRHLRQIRVRDVANAATKGNKRLPGTERFMDKKIESGVVRQNIV
jgi:hypothetical protein